MNPHELEDYLRWGEQGFPDASREWDDLDDDARLAEAVSLGLRQTVGFNLADVERDCAVLFSEPVFAKWESAKCLERVNETIRLMDQGWPLLDEICADILAKSIH